MPINEGKRAKTAGRCRVGKTSVLHRCGFVRLEMETPRGGGVKTCEDCVNDSAGRAKLPLDWAAPTLRFAPMRAFVAIDLPDHVREELRALQQGLRIGRLVPTENLHLTLSFLGEQSDEEIREAHQALSTVHNCAFELQLAGVDAFGGRMPQAIVADVRQCDALNSLEQRIVRSLRSAGLKFKKQRFRPHVTIARLRKFSSESELEQVRNYLAGNAVFQASCFTVKQFSLYQSTLRPEKALHEVLASYDLTAA